MIVHPDDDNDALVELAEYIRGSCGYEHPDPEVYWWAERALKCISSPTGLANFRMLCISGLKMQAKHLDPFIQENFKDGFTQEDWEAYQVVATFLV